MTTTLYEVYAIKYAHHERNASANFLGGDPHDGPMPMDYFVWLVRGAGRVIVVDTGFNAQAAARRGRSITRPVEDGLRAMGVDPAAVEDVVITHLHYDHVGNFDLFPKAMFHLQDLEMQYATGRYMTVASIRHSYDEENVVGMVRRVYAERVRFHDGEGEVAPGVTLHHVGGHTMGLQIVRVATRRGWVVLASDASHYYANMEQGRPYPIIYNVGDMVDGWRRAHALADSPGHVIPGHDPLVLERYPAPEATLKGSVARLD
jgi:glyoxylase-like metal-dependent hydrolase (beta-lactamase superfamily II)